MSRRSRYAYYAIPLVALLGVAVVYALFALPPSASPAAMDYTFNLLVQFTNNNGSAVRAVAPSRVIGEPGGYWNTTQYNHNGVDSSHYPLYMDDPTTSCKPYCVIHVKSTVVHSYTLGDFFNVWGYPVSQNLTLTQHSYGTFAWELCIGQGGSTTSSSQWGNLVLTPSLDITLFFYDTTGLGCAPS